MARNGLATGPIIVTGLDRTSLDEVYRALGQRDGAAITQLNPQELVPRLSQLPWIADVSVQRIFPGTLDIRIAEKQPLAVLHLPGAYTAIDATGAHIAPADAGLIQSLPNIAGTGAEDEAANLLFDLSQFPQIRDRFIGATRIGQRRWNLYLDPGIEIRLPESGARQALQTLQDMNRFNQILIKNWLRLICERSGPLSCVKTKNQAS